MTTQQMLDERYGRTRRGATRWAVVAGILAAVIAVVAFAWLTVSNSLDAVDADTTGFQVIDEHSVALEFQVSAPAGRVSRSPSFCARTRSYQVQLSHCLRWAELAPCIASSTEARAPHSTRRRSVPRPFRCSPGYRLWDTHSSRNHRSLTRCTR